MEHRIAQKGGKYEMKRMEQLAGTGLLISEHLWFSAIFQRKIRQFLRILRAILRSSDRPFFSARADHPNSPLLIFLEPIKRAYLCLPRRNFSRIIRIFRYPFLRYNPHGSPRGSSAKKAADLPLKNRGESLMLRNQQPWFMAWNSKLYAKVQW